MFFGRVYADSLLIGYGGWLFLLARKPRTTKSDVPRPVFVTSTAIGGNGHGSKEEVPQSVRMSMIRYVPRVGDCESEMLCDAFRGKCR